MRDLVHLGPFSDNPQERGPEGLHPTRHGTTRVALALLLVALTAALTLGGKCDGGHPVSTDFADMKLQPYKETEADIQGRLVDHLRILGFEVLCTDRHRRKCPNCGKTDSRPDAMNAGIPDVMVTHRNWAKHVWLGIEMKRDAKSKVRPKQAMLAEQGRVFLCWDDEVAVRLVQSFHKDQLRRAE